MRSTTKPPSRKRTLKVADRPGPEKHEAASDWTAYENGMRILQENPQLRPSKADSITKSLRRELMQKGLKGFKKGGPVTRTGIYKLHKGEHVVPARRRPAARKR